MLLTHFVYPAVATLILHTNVAIGGTFFGILNRTVEMLDPENFEIAVGTYQLAELFSIQLVNQQMNM
jgi:hypothetical protein